MSKQPKVPISAALASYRKPTLKTIAELSGLAVPTVSRALKDAPDINSETKKLVRKVATEIGYVPHPAGVRLRTGRTFVISLVLSTSNEMMTHAARLMAAMVKELRGTPYHLIITPFFPDEDPMTPVRYVVETGAADALILNETTPDDARVKYLLERGFPFATHGRSRYCEQHPYFDYDNLSFGRIAVEALVQKKRRFIWMLAPPPQHNYALNMIEGAKTACTNQGLTLYVSEAINSEQSIEEVTQKVTELLKNEPQLDAFICASTNAAIGVTAALEALGKTIGVDMDIVAKEAIPFLKLFRPRMLIMQEDVTAAGTWLCQAVLQAIEHPERAPLQNLEIPQFAELEKQL
ncbi:MAG: LacI family DNA-binding transcriptional regulator [Thiothrix sp.]|nr:MAG: LacI family DNA-binding transcriptional regulator [Thiothrix sp.]